ncbi:hypothetical protein PHAVU_006G202800 [Phaseolus vulgaris]|uniref:Uncharacterized protein n=1 Tax=Phaseolus vulgaris TaxID=3885 RepID=V7BUW8_PHAVU|nr:hypothetical protein PHAVU_006G202800g [Phaseolus vulgaris]ESW20366.1 hypothetical protein PHAVU_006G202800g [Phaseolus vulgaris]
MASSTSSLITFFLLSLIFSTMDIGQASRHLLQTTAPNLPTIPSLPTIPTLPQPSLPTMPTLPQFTLPPLPATVLPTIPTTIPSFPFLSPPPSATTSP